ncbi:hypothetical protein SUGI_1146900 [Cryptomeria japonica]|nr:hypothetical protein SUGI_1146900 [Cryptomeria japonica]
MFISYKWQRDCSCGLARGRQRAEAEQKEATIEEGRGGRKALPLVSVASTFSVIIFLNGGGVITLSFQQPDPPSTIVFIPVISSDKVEGNEDYFEVQLFQVE